MPALGSDPRLARAVYGNVSQLEEAAFTEILTAFAKLQELLLLVVVRRRRLFARLGDRHHEYHAGFCF